MLKRMLAALALVLAPISVSEAQVVPTPPPYSALGGAVPLAVDTSGESISLPGNAAYQAITVYNKGSVDASIAIGPVGTTANTSNTCANNGSTVGPSCPVPAGTYYTFFANGATTLAGVTGASATTLVIYSGSGPIQFGEVGGTGGGGGSGTVTDVSTNNGLTGGPITTAGTVGLASIANNGVLCNNSGTTGPPITGNCQVTGTGEVVEQTSPSVTNLTVTSALTATGLVTNSDLVNSTTTVGGASCALGGSCAPVVPISSGVSGLGTGVSGALADNVGSAGAVVVNGGALGTPASGTATNITGLPLSGLTSEAANTLVANASGSSAAPTAVSLASLGGTNSCGGSNNALTYNSSTHAFGCNTITPPSSANPSVSVGLSAVNGTATTFMTSDSAPPLSQAITPTWTGLHKFTNGDLSVLGSSTGYTQLESANASATNYIATLPAATDTVTELTQTQTITNKTIAYSFNTLTGVAPTASPTFSGTVTMPDSGTWGSGGINGSIIGGTTPEAVTSAALTVNGAANVNTNNNAVTNIGTGSTTSTVSIGGGSDHVVVTGDGTTSTINAVEIGATTAEPAFFTTLNASGVTVVSLNTSSLPAAQSGTALRVAQANSTNTRLEEDSFAGTDYFSAIRADGTAASPSTLQAADEIGGLNVWGYDGSAFAGPRAAFRCFANQNWTTSAQGTYCDVATTPNGATAEAQVLEFQNDAGMTTPGVTGGDEGAGTINAAGLYVSGAAVLTGNVPLSDLATQAANTLVGNATGSSASPTALAVPSCSGSSNALTWTTSTGFGCNTISGGGGGSPGGSNTQVQYNNSSAFGGISGVTSNGTLLTIANGDLQLVGTSTGHTTLNSGLSGSSNSTLTLPTTASDTLAALATAQTFSVAQTFSSNIAITGTSLPTQAAGTMGLGGEASTPTLGASGEGNMWISTTNGLSEIGEGSSNDQIAYDKAGNYAWEIPTGTQNLNVGGQVVLTNTAGSASAPQIVLNSTNTGIYAPSTASEMCLADIAGSCKLDYGITSASIATVQVSLHSNQSSGTVAFDHTNTSTASAVAFGADGANNGMYAPAASELGFSIGGTVKGDYAVTNSAAWTLQGSNFYLPGISSSSAATTGTLCWTTSTGLVNVDTTLACLSSLEELKDIHSYMGGDALADVMQLKPFWFSWKHETPEWRGGDHAVEPGFGAHQVYGVDPRLTASDADGTLRGVRYQEMTALLAAAIQEQERKIEALTTQLSALSAANDNGIEPVVASVGMR